MINYSTALSITAVVVLSHIFHTTNTTTTAFAPPTLSATAIKEKNVNFGDWIANSPDEITKWKRLTVEGTIPSYVQGTLIRNGGGIWSVPNESYSHIFDGLAKISCYRIDASNVEYQARFLQGSWYKKYLKNNRQQLPQGIGTGPVLDVNEEPKSGFLRILQVLIDTVASFDNTPVNIFDWSPKVHQGTKKRISALTDAPPRTAVDFDTMDTISTSTINSFANGQSGYELLITAHPMYSQNKNDSGTSVDSYNVAVELGLNGPMVNLVKENSEGERTVISSFACEDDGKIPYCHSFGLSKNYAMIVLQPLRLNNSALEKLIELGFLRSMDHVEDTRVVLIELSTGKVVLDKKTNEKVYFYHSISQAETLEDGNSVVSLRLCAYKTPDQLTGEHQFMRMEKCRKSRELRNKLHKGGTFCDVVCNLTDQSVKVKWNDQIQQGFELPVTRYSRTFNGELPPPNNPNEIQAHPRYVYSFGAYALGSQDYDNWGLFKFDMNENKIDAYHQQDSVYLSEPVFVADPEGTKEDDGVLLSQAYFGKKQETKLLVFDAANMKVIAEVPTGLVSPLDFHGTFIPH